MNRMKKKTNITFIKTTLIFKLLFLTACSTDSVDSEDINPEAIHQNLIISHTAGENSTEAQATFRVGGPSGTTVELNGSSSIRVNQRSLGRSNFLGTHYSGEIDTPTKFVYNWLYTDENETRYANSIAILDFSLLEVPREIDRDQDFVVTFVGEPLRKGEYYEAKMSYRTQASSYHIRWFQVKVIENKLVIFKEDIRSELGTDAYFIEIAYRRVYKKRLAQTTKEGGSMKAEFKSRVIELELANSN